MLEDDDIFSGLLGLRETLAEYLGCGVQLEAPTVGVFVATIDFALGAYEAEKKERAFDELIRSGAAELEKKRPVRAHIIAGPQKTGMGAATIYEFRRRAPAPVSGGFNPGGDAA